MPEHLPIFSNSIFFAYDSSFRDHEAIEHTIRLISKSFGLDVVTAAPAKASKEHYLTDKILPMIANCEFMVADAGLRKSRRRDQIVTNPNVMLEIGYAWALQKDVILLVKKENKKKTGMLEGHDFLFWPKCLKETLPKVMGDLAKQVVFPESMRIYGEYLQWYEAMTRAEEIVSGQRRLMNDFFPAASRPPDLTRKRYAAIPAYRAKAEEFVKLAQRRQQALKRDLEKGYEFRDILYAEELSRHIQEPTMPFNVPSTPDDLRRWFESYKELAQHPNYDLRIIQGRLPNNVEILGNEKVALFEIAEPQRKISFVSGMHWTATAYVQWLSSEFDRLWHSIRGRQFAHKRAALAWIEDLIRQTEREFRRRGKSKRRQ